MKLARVFQDNIILQQNKPIAFFGECDKDEDVIVKVNGKETDKIHINKGNFRFYISPLKASFNNTIELNGIVLHNVDVGEVFYATGQSNMEFIMDWEMHKEELENVKDDHVRMYTVGRYYFKGERELGYKNWNDYDKWESLNNATYKDMSAVALFFALKLKEKRNVPVGIINASVGGTTASAWVRKEVLENNPKLHVYLDEWNEIMSHLNLERYYFIRSKIRPMMESKEAKERSSFIKKYTFKPEELLKMLFADANKANDDNRNGFSWQEAMQKGPGNENEPSALFENMVKEVLGYTVKGVIYYQGETDEGHADIYDELYGSLIKDYRLLWNDDLPFITALIAPYGTWMHNSSDNYPTLRKSQMKAAEKLDNVYLASTTDVGNVYDIHPKDKKTVGERMALIALKYLYGMDVLCDAPVFDKLNVIGNKIELSFNNADGLFIKEKTFDTYNGFEAKDIDPKLLPYITDKVNGLLVMADGKRITETKTCTEGNKLIIETDTDLSNKKIRVEFANTGFYEVNLYNKANLPAMPFVCEK